MNTPQEIQDLVARVVHRYSDAHLELEPLPSGVCFFWVSFGNRNFCIEHHPRDGTGVSENLPTTTPFDGADRVFPSLREAIEQFERLLADAGRRQEAALTAG